MLRKAPFFQREFRSWTKYVDMIRKTKEHASKYTWEKNCEKRKKLNIRDDRCNHFTPQRLGYRTRAVMKHKSGAHFQRKIRKKDWKRKHWFGQLPKSINWYCSRCNYQHRTLFFKCNFSILFTLIETTIADQSFLWYEFRFCLLPTFQGTFNWLHFLLGFVECSFQFHE